MITAIDQSPHWRGRHTTTQDWTKLLESLFRFQPARRPASHLEVLLISSALACAEAAIERYRPGGKTRLLLMGPPVARRYTPTMPA